MDAAPGDSATKRFAMPSGSRHSSGGRIFWQAPLKAPTPRTAVSAARPVTPEALRPGACAAVPKSHR
eukprot:CAMPEP_0181537754 /NCGR_PEP_ID=MMETSP1110-20121109/75516_1 /TAXON_ID=174948 /ORGANISM="Symbiodinium sp., Strain CCMP421" /LENGTH=66 /DNA_ID=CAMNT_0023669339 /DNA_START=71 /DNA_END=269 /DNA_ORIENTATION=+